MTNILNKIALDFVSEWIQNSNVKYTVERTEDFNRWLSKLKDIQAKQRIILRLQYIEDGNFGDHESVGKGVSELRIHIGKGYRAYYTIRQRRVVFMLCGGDKSTQQKDIQKAIQIAETIK